MNSLMKHALFVLAAFVVVPLATLASIPDGGPITEITMERIPCYDSCARYSVVVRSDGSVSYDGKKNVPWIGKRRGKISAADFQMLVNVIQSEEYFRLKNNYKSKQKNTETVVTTVVRGGKRKRVVHQGELGPESLLKIEAALEDLILLGVEFEGEEKGK